MYSIDVNFLKDRHLAERVKTASVAKIPSGIDLRKQQPILIGIGVGVGLLALTSLLGFFVNWQKTQTEAQIGSLDAELGQLQGQTKKLEGMKAQLAALEQENRALVSVFDRIRPWSAIVQEISQQTPPAVQVKSIQQVDLPPDPGQTGPKTQIKISGIARNYEAVNHYLLTLQGSPFLNAEKTAIENAALADILVPLEKEKSNVKITIPQGVQYSIVTELKDTPVSQQLANIARNRAVGVVTRIETLKQQGALQP
ncbi:PilN domain-containing protein [Pannus brasiliensis CCIBt3594]|uniref:PilN domain-containing protein n=1 Tax=Pannus brasiliensis CCIBt3594 TaxID=1427578 RepID=A0AAW9QTX2_9CHRO